MEVFGAGVGKNRQKLCVEGQVFEKALKRPVTRWQILPRWKEQRHTSILRGLYIYT